VKLLDWAGLAATTAGTALPYTLTGFGFAVLAAPLFLLFVDPPRAIQLVIIISTALSFVAWCGRILRFVRHEARHRNRDRVGRRCRHRVMGMPGPPVLIYLLLAGAPPRIVRSTLLSFFALAYAASLACHVVTVGIPTGTWLSAGILIPFAFLGALAGRPLGDRVGADAFAILAILLLTAAGLCTLAAAAAMAVR
jgi:uncharacterized membrane protein YfcA